MHGGIMFKTLGAIGASIFHLVSIWRTSNRNRYKRWFTRTQQQRQWQRRVADLITTRKGLAWLCQWCPMSPTYRRPWFLMVGAPQSGKTSVIGQMFSHTTSLSTQGVQLFQTRQAVCLEMTLMPKSSTFLRSGHFLLSMIRHYRRRQPLDALVWVIDLPKMLCQEESQWLDQIKQGQRCLLEIQRTIKKSIPMYVLFTKLDAIHHFEQFAEHVLVPNPIGFDRTKIDEQQALCQLSVVQQLEYLVQSWQRQRMHAWQTVMQLDEQLAIYDFPEQFNQAQQRLQRWFEYWFAAAGDVLLDGIFFSTCLRKQPSRIMRSLANPATTFLPIASTLQTPSTPDTNRVTLDRAWLPLHANIATIWRIGWMHDRTASWLRYVIMSGILLLSGWWMHHVYQTVKIFLLELSQIQQSVERGQAATWAGWPQKLIRHQQLMTQSQQRHWYQSLGLWQTQGLERQTKHAVMRKLQATILQSLPEQLIEALTTYHRRWAELTVEQRIEQYPLYAAYFDLFQWLYHLALRPTNNAPWLRVALQQLSATSVSTWPPQALQYVIDHYQPEPSKTQTTEERLLMQQVQKDLQTMTLQPTAHYQWLRLGGLTINERETFHQQPALPFFYTVAGWQQWVRPMLIQRLNDPMLAQISTLQRQRLARQIIAQYVEDVSKQWLQTLQREWFVDVPQTVDQWFDESTAWLDVQKKAKAFLTVLKHQRVEFNQLH
ncbi:MAG: hypothetical protein GKR77_06620, partial [Legionellales bacterium]|nr:hypothetical protein [Legionellales bacterium]